jgi:hypothetical protein
MKAMSKKLLLLSLAVLIGISAFSQVKVGIKGGLNLADLKYEPRDQTNGTPDANSLASLHAGVIVDIPLVEGLSFQPGAMFTGKGSKVEYSGTLGTFTQKINPFYIEVPANFLFKPTIGRNTKLYLGLGPYLAVGVGGKSSSNAESSVGSFYTDHTLKFGNDSDDDLKATDFGGNVLAGFEFGNGLILGAQYGLSFTNNAPDGNNDAPKILRNKVFSVSLGYYLGK